MMWPRGELCLCIRSLIAVGLVVAAQGLSLGLPFLYKAALDRLALPSISVPVVIIVAYGLSRFASQVLQSLRQLIFAPVAQRAIRTTSLEAFAHLHTLSLRFHLDRKAGGLPRIIDRGTSALHFLLELALFQVAPIIVELVAVAVILASLYGASYSTIVVATTIAYALYTGLQAGRQTDFRRAMNQHDIAAGSAMVDSIINYESVQYFSAEAHELRRVEGLRRAYENSAIKFESARVRLVVGQALIVAAGSIAVMLLAASEVTARSMTIGDFVLINTYLLQFYAPLGAFALIYANVRQALVDVETMSDLLAEEPEVKDSPTAAGLVVSSGTIEFERVSFGYDRKRKVLDEISFTIPAGRSLALVGATGGGKSTITRLLFRFYDASGGAIRIDGQDIRYVSRKSLRAAIAVVPQDVVLLNDTIRANLLFANPGAGDDELGRAIEAAQLAESIRRMPDGLETMVGERGLKLSGGEKQRLAIARAMLKGSPLLILDEATSSLDVRTERQIQQSLRDMAVGKTTLIVAHRLTMARAADEIVVLEKGRIVERGSHAELVAFGGHYANMWRHQNRKSRVAKTRS